MVELVYNQALQEQLLTMLVAVVDKVITLLRAQADPAVAVQEHQAVVPLVE